MSSISEPESNSIEQIELNRTQSVIVIIWVRQSNELRSIVFCEEICLDKGNVMWSREQEKHVLYLSHYKTSKKLVLDFQHKFYKASRVEKSKRTI